MKRYAFTLIELMIAIVLVGLLVTFLMQTMGSAQIQSKQMQKAVKVQKRLTRVVTLLQKDVLESFMPPVILSRDDYAMIKLHTTHSIYGIDAPYVLWMIDAGSKHMVRMESAQKAQPPFNIDRAFALHTDIVETQCAWFKAYVSKDKSALLIGFRCQNRPYILELATPQYLDQNSSK